MTAATELSEEAKASDETEPVAGVAARPRGRVAHRPGWRFDLGVLVLCVAIAFYLTRQLWADPNQRVVSHNRGDQALFEWLLGYAAHSVSHLDNPLWTTLLNVPMGVNLAVNTSMVVVGGVMAPITLTLGASVAFLVVLTANLAFTAFAWWWVLSRYIAGTRAGALLGALFCGFAPGVVSHANAHLNFTGQFLVPFILLCVLKLAWGAPPVRTGLLLGVLVVLEFSIGAEMLFFVALALALFVGVWSLLCRAQARAAARGVLTGIAVAVPVALVCLAYPLYMEFLGPQRYHGIGFDQKIHSENLVNYGSYAYLSLARLVGLYNSFAPNFTEETTFFGIPLLILSVWCAVVLWRRREVRALCFTAIVFAVLSLGPVLHIGHWDTHLPLPYDALAQLPFFDSALPARLALILIPALGILLALGVDRALPLPGPQRWRWLAAFVVALLPIVPLPIPAIQRDPVPHFFTDGTWKQYVHSGQTLVPVPPPSDLLPDGQRWQTATHFGFAIPAGFFLGPGGPGGRSRIGPIPRPTYDLLAAVALDGLDRGVSDVDRRHAREDLAYWNATVIVMSDPGAGGRWAGNAPVLRKVATELFGPPQRVDDVWLWRVPLSATS